MDFTLYPSMQNFCAVAIAVDLWSSSKDIRDDLVQFITIKQKPKTTYLSAKKPNFFETKLLESKILDSISARLHQLPLPGILRARVRKILKPIGNEIFTGYNVIFCEKVKPFFYCYFDNLRWTPWGRVDKQATVESLLRNVDINIELRYVWFCTFMCGKYNTKEWEQCKMEMKKHLERKMFRLNSNGSVSPSVDFSKLLRRRQLEELRPFLSVEIPNCPRRRTCLTEMVVGKRNEKTFEQFWLNLSREKKIDIVDKLANKLFHSSPVCCTEVVFFLLSEMTVEQRTIFYKNNAHFIVMLILRDWPRREIFISTLKEMRNFDVGVANLLFEIGGFGTVGFPDPDELHKLFEELWNFDPNTVKQIVVDWHWYFVDMFLTSLDSKSVKLILTNVDVEQEKEILARVKRHVINILPSYGTNENSNLVDDFLTDIALSEKDISDLKTSVWHRHRYVICV